MSDTLKDMRERRSCRSYRKEHVERELLEQVIEAGLWAASGMNRQAAKVVAVTDPVLRDRLAEMNRKIGGWPEGFDPFYGAPDVLIVLGDRSCPTYLYDGSLVMGNLMLAAHALGLGTCWIHRAKEEFASPEGREILAALGVEGDLEGIGHCVIGYPTGEFRPAAPRKEGRVFWAEADR